MSRSVRPIRINGHIACVELTKGYTAIIDVDDVPLVDGVNWCAQISRRKDGSIYAVYATRKDLQADGLRAKVYLHRVLMGNPDGLGIDHADCDGMNNRRSNLRVATASQNMQNRRQNPKTTSGVKGVCWHKASQKWVCRIALDGKRRFIGSFSTKEEAAAAYARASPGLHGAFGRSS